MNNDGRTIRRVFMDYHGTMADPKHDLPPERDLVLIACTDLPGYVTDGVLSRYGEALCEHSLPKLMPTHGDVLYEHVLDGDQSLIERFTKAVTANLGLSRNLGGALKYLERREIRTDIVTNVSSGSDPVLDQLFANLIVHGIAD